MEVNGCMNLNKGKITHAVTARKAQGYATSFYKLSMPQIRPKRNLGSNQRIPSCSCTYSLVSAPGDILNKTWLAGGGDDKD